MLTASARLIVSQCGCAVNDHFTRVWLRPLCHIFCIYVLLLTRDALVSVFWLHSNCRNMLALGCVLEKSFYGKLSFLFCIDGIDLPKLVLKILSSLFYFTSDLELPSVLHCHGWGFAHYAYTPLCRLHVTVFDFGGLLDPLVLEMFA